MRRRTLLEKTKIDTKGYLAFISDSNSASYMLSGGGAVEYSIDGGINWTTLESDTYTPTIPRGTPIMWRGELTPTSSRGIGTFKTKNASTKFDAEGTPMSLLFGDNFSGKKSLDGKDYAFIGLFKGSNVKDIENLKLPATTLSSRCYSYMFNACRSLTAVSSDLLPATTLKNYCYAYMFYGCSNLTTPPNLPARVMEDNCYSHMFSECTSLITVPSGLSSVISLEYSCYSGMFQGCSSLTTVPSDLLPVTSLHDWCYYYMFYGCSNLTTAPDLPATAMTNYCYAHMFKGCSSLTTSPVLPASTLYHYCYYNMFSGCTNLNSITCLATTTGGTSITSATTEWVTGVAYNGTFTKNKNMNNWSRNVNGIPSQWTVQNYS